MSGTGECSLRIAPTPDAPQQFTAELHGPTNELFRTKSDDSAFGEMIQTYLKSAQGNEFVQEVLAQGGTEIPMCPAEGGSIFKMCRQDSTEGAGGMSRQGSLEGDLHDFLQKSVDAFVQEAVSTISPKPAVVVADVEAGFSGLGASITAEDVVRDGVNKMSADILDKELSIGTTGVAVAVYPSNSEIRVVYISEEHLKKLDAAIKAGNNQFASPSMLDLVGEFCGNLDSNGGTGHRKNSAILWQCRHCWPTLSNHSEWFPCSGRHWNAAGLAYQSEHSGREYETPKRHCGVCLVKHSLEVLTKAAQQQYPKYSPEAISGEVTKERAKWEKRCKKQPQRPKRKAIEGAEAEASIPTKKMKLKAAPALELEPEVEQRKPIVSVSMKILTCTVCNKDYVAKYDYKGNHPKCPTCRVCTATVHVRTNKKRDNGTNLTVSLSEPLEKLEKLVESSAWGKENGADMAKQQLYFYDWRNVKVALTDKKIQLKRYGVVPITETIAAPSEPDRLVQVQLKGRKSIYLEDSNDK